MEPDTLSEAAIVDTVAAVFSAAEYSRSLRETLFQRFVEMLYRAWHWFRGLASSDPGMYWTFVVLLALVLVAVAARVFWVIRARQVRSGQLAAEQGGALRATSRRDPWRVARDESARGNYTEAAHALYAALLETLARRDQIRLHPAKTIGDYVRELRGRSSAFFERFRDFARSYEHVVYGLGSCDRDRYERLDALARMMLQAEGPA